MSSGGLSDWEANARSLRAPLDPRLFRRGIGGGVFGKNVERRRLVSTPSASSVSEEEAEVAEEGRERGKGDREKEKRVRFAV